MRILNPIGVSQTGVPWNTILKENYIIPLKKILRVQINLEYTTLSSVIQLSFPENFSDHLMLEEGCKRRIGNTKEINLTPVEEIIGNKVS